MVPKTHHTPLPKLKPLFLSMHLLIVSGFIVATSTTDVLADTSTTQATQHYSIPAGPLSKALTQFSARAGIYLVGATELAKGKQSQGLNATMTVDAALATLLQGTGLKAVRQQDNSYALEQDTASLDGQTLELPTVEVKGQSVANGQASNAYRVSSVSSGALGTTTLQNTPFTIESFSQDYIENTQARSISDVTKFDAAVSLSASNFLGENNSFNIRGITPDFDTGQKIDGLNLRSRAKDFPLEHVERVEILKGAGGFLYGFGAPGGIINYVLKRPTDEFTASLNTQVMDSGLFLVHGDVGGRWGPDDQFGFRVNAVREAGDTYIEDGSSYRKSASIALDWRITPDLLWQVNALEASRKSYGGYFYVLPASSSDIIKPIDGDKRIAPDWTRYESGHKTYTTDLSWQFLDNWNNKLSYGYSSNYRNPLMPVISSDADGNYSATLYNYNNVFKSHQIQDVISGFFETGFIQHNLNIGYSHTRTISSNSTGLGLSQYSLGTGNLSNPTEFIQPVQHRPYSDAKFNEYSSITRKEIFISDTLHLGDQWDLILGIRRGTLDDKYGDYKESANTPTLAAIFRPIEWMSIYASYIEAFEEGAVAPATTVNAFEVFEPLVSKQYEIGMKVDQDNWSANLAVFKLEKGLTYTDTSTNVFSQDGQAHYEGVELSAKTKLTPDWMVSASAMLLDATNKKTTDEAMEGQNMQGVAEKQLRLYTEYHIPNTYFTVTGGSQYTGKRPVDAYGQSYVGSVTLFDLGGRYEIKVNNHPLTIRLNIENLTDEAYWLTSAGSNGIAQGMPRTVKLGAQLDF
ncbi:MAG: TonB-dependent receptor [Pseudomonadota bacterium]|uniref:TonB-dependent siderophore receptor n=1 Tax=Methylophaga aminisulfidivorans TaxID=230105 RepID=UPI0024E1BBE6|nr:TonB-dependent receptor [Methylophaga aminisulfidivorans]MEC9412741.1 TonB-dependent receptor [Pseudomonadota bacterium]